MMQKILVIGGTAMLGEPVAQAALSGSPEEANTLLGAPVTTLKAWAQRG